MARTAAGQGPFPNPYGQQPHLVRQDYDDSPSASPYTSTTRLAGNQPYPDHAHYGGTCHPLSSSFPPHSPPQGANPPLMPATEVLPTPPPSTLKPANHMALPFPTRVKLPTHTLPGPQIVKYPYPWRRLKTSFSTSRTNSVSNATL